MHGPTPNSSSTSPLEVLTTKIDNVLYSSSDGYQSLPFDKLIEFTQEISIRAVPRCLGCCDDMEEFITYTRHDAPRLFPIFVILGRKTPKQRLRHFFEAGFD